MGWEPDAGRLATWDVSTRRGRQPDATELGTQRKRDRPARGMNDDEEWALFLAQLGPGAHETRAHDGAPRKKEA